MKKFSHKAISLQGEKPLIYTAITKHLFYYRMFISKFVLENGGVPLNPYMLFDYFLLDTVDRDLVRHANNVALSRSDEFWIFGSISDGVLAEITQAKKNGIPLRYFSVDHSQGITECSTKNVEMEPEVDVHRELL